MESDTGKGKLVCVTGASGFIASWLVKFLLLRGYTVKGTVRDPNDSVKVDHLLKLDGAKERLQLIKANLMEEGSFDLAVEGCEGVFHTASPVVHNVKDPQVDVNIVYFMKEFSFNGLIWLYNLFTFFYHLLIIFYPFLADKFGNYSCMEIKSPITGRQKLQHFILANFSNTEDIVTLLNRLLLSLPLANSKTKCCIDNLGRALRLQVSQFFEIFILCCPNW